LQSTLLGLAIAMIVALVAALVGPLLVDWSGYRAAFEAEATRLIGLDVRVTGTIDARLLPSPQLTLHDIEIGGVGERKVRARSLGIEFALGPLMRGEWRASEMHLTGPQLTLVVDASGRVQAPDLAIGFNPEALSIDRLSIVDGRITFADAANGTDVTLDHIWFNGVARSLLGPFTGEGAANAGGDLYPFRLSTGRYSEDGKLKLRLAVEPVDRPLSAVVDGTLMFAGGKPQFDGALDLTRPVAIAARATGALTQPWHVSGKLTATAGSALMRNFEFQYGSHDKGFKLTGAADLNFGRKPRLDGVLSASLIDFDRALGDGEGNLSPSVAVARLAQWASQAILPKIPMQIGIAIDRATVGGDVVQNLRGDISTVPDGWSLDRFEFRAPGLTQVRMSGRLAVDEQRVSFTGPAEVTTNNPKAFAAWLEGRSAASTSELRPLSLRGELSLAGDRVALDRFTAQFDSKTVAGTLAYAFAAGARSARVDATVRAPELDLDALLAFGHAMLAGVPIEWPHDMSIAADIGRATLAGLDARDLSARIDVDRDGLRIDNLSIADLGGASFAAHGRIVTAPSPQGNITVDLNARDMTPVVALASRFWPDARFVSGASVAAMAPAQLHAQLSVDDARPKAAVKLTIGGNLGKTAVALNGHADVDPASLQVGDFSVSSKFDNEDGQQLVKILGLERALSVDSGSGALQVTAGGPLRGAWDVAAALTAGSLEAKASGRASPLADKPSADLKVSIARANLAPLLGDTRAPLPVSYSSAVTLATDALNLRDINATIGGSALRGSLSFGLASPHRLQGRIDADHLDGARVIAAAIGMPAPVDSRGPAWTWPDDPFSAGLFGDYAGRISLKARAFDLLPHVTVREFGANLQFGNQQISLEDTTGDVAGGRLTGSLSFVRAHTGLHAHTTFTLAGADIDALLPAAGGRSPITGTLAIKGDLEGTGLSPIALIGSLQGTATFSLAGAQFVGLNPRTFETVTKAVDQGLVVDHMRIADLVSKNLESGSLSIARAHGEIAVSAGQARLEKCSVESKDVHLSASGSVDLTTGALDGRLVLAGVGEQAGARPEIFVALKGPLAAPARSIDVAALTGWLTLRSVDNKAKQIRAIEQAAPPAAPRPLPKTESVSVTRSIAPVAPKKNVGAVKPIRPPAEAAPPLPPPIAIGRPAAPYESTFGAER